MIENILTVRGLSLKSKVTVKCLISVGVIALAVVLPQLFHSALGAQGGVEWLPMYAPVLLGACLLGWAWGLGIGVLSPAVSFLITLAFGDPMPAAARLPFMAAELAVFAIVAGSFSGKIAKNGRFAFPAVISAQIAGRSTLMLLSLIFGTVSPITPAAAWGQIEAGLHGLAVQAVMIPAVVAGLRPLLTKDRND